MLLRRVLRRRLVRASIETEVLRRVLRRGAVIEGAEKAETRPFAEYDPVCVHPKNKVGTKDSLFELRIFLRKMLRNFPRSFRAFISGVAPANQTKERPVHGLFISGAFRNKSSM